MRCRQAMSGTLQPDRRALYHIIEFGQNQSPHCIGAICILKSTLFVNLFIFTFVTFGVYVASSPLRHATTSLEDCFFPVLTMLTLSFLARARLTLLVYNACRTRLRGWLCLVVVTSPPLTCLGSYTGSLLNH